MAAETIVPNDGMTIKKLDAWEDLISKVPDHFIKKIELLHEKANMMDVLANRMTKYYFWILDFTDLSWKYFSPNVEQILGYKPEDLLNIEVGVTTFTEESNEQAARLAIHEWENEMNSEKTDLNRIRTFVFEQIKNDGQRVWIEHNATILREENNNPLSFFGMSQDVTEVIKKETKMGNMISDFSHDARNPIHNILSYTHLCNERVEDPKIREYLENIKSSAEMLDTFIQNSLDQTLVEGGNLVIEKQLIDIFEIFRISQESTRVKLKQNRIDLIIEKTEESCNVHVDYIKILRVLQNLILNAIKQSQPATKIILRVLKFKDELQVDLLDEAGGIPGKGKNIPITLEELYENANKMISGAYGMGLRLSKEFIEAHGGKIWSTNNDMGGATFSFTLPF